MSLDVEKLKKLREKKGMSLGEAAEAAGLNSRQAWWNIENREDGKITLATLEKVAAALGVKARDLLK